MSFLTRRRYIVRFLTAAILTVAVASDSFARGEKSAARPPPNEELVYRSKNLQAFAQLRRSGIWCAKQTKVHLYIRDDSVFAGDREELNTFLAEFPGILRSKCDKARSSRVKGFINDKPVYTASITSMHKTPKISERITSRKVADKYREAVAPAAPVDAEAKADRWGEQETSETGTADSTPDAVGGQGQTPTRKESRLFSEAQTVGQQCNVLGEWVNRFFEEYPSFDIRASRPEEFEVRAVNLFSDAHFVPVFGEPYDGTSVAMRRQIFNEIFRRCPKKFRFTPGVGAVFKSAFGGNFARVNPETLPDKVRGRREIRTWLQQQQDELDSIPATSAGFDRLHNLATEGTERISDLWPSEQRSFNGPVLARKSHVALSVANDRIASLPSQAESLTKLESVVAWAEAQVIDSVRVQFAALTQFADRRRGEIRVALVKAETAALAGYPDTVASLNRIKERREWLAKTVGQPPLLPAMGEFEQASASRSEEIARAALPGFRKELRRLPLSFTGAKQAVERFSDIADLLGATAPAQKDAYQKAALARAVEIYDQMIAKAITDIRSTKGGWRDAISLVSSSQGEAGKFGGTPTRERASQIVWAAREKAESMVNGDLRSFKKVLAKTPETWAGFEQVVAIGRAVDENREIIPALTDYRPIVSVRRSELVTVLTREAVKKIEATGKGYEDVESVEAVSRSYRGKFSNASEADAVAQVNDATSSRVNELIRESLPRFQKELARRGNTRENAAELLEVAAAFDQRAETWGAFKPYAESARRRSEQALVAVCDAAVRKSGISDKVAKMDILGPQQPLSVPRFICDLDENGHFVSELSSVGSLAVKDGYTMKIFQSDGQYSYIKLHEVEAMPGRHMLVGFARGDANQQVDMTVSQWRTHLAELIGKSIPSAVAGRSTVDLAARLERSVAIVVVTDATGSGFFVSPTMLVTNRHVVEGADPNNIMVTNKVLGKVRTGRVIAISTGRNVVGERDYALVSFDEELPIDPLLITPVAPKLAQVVSAGYPGFLTKNDPRYLRLIGGDSTAAPEMIFSAGEISVVQETSRGIPTIVHTALISQGNSGGPLVDLCGRVVGINTFYETDKNSPRVAFNSLGGDDLIAFMQENGAEFEVARETCPN